jgi:hypothetical protein
MILKSKNWNASSEKKKSLETHWTKKYWIGKNNKKEIANAENRENYLIRILEQKDEELQKMKIIIQRLEISNKGMSEEI